MSEGRYAATIYVAAPGTPLVEGGESLPGHMYFTTTDRDGQVSSFGFAPTVHGSMNGLGKPVRDDVTNYVDPLYSRTMEVTKEQFDRLNEFGSNPERFGFDMQYKDVRNNCVDFTWAALDHAGIKHQRYLSVPTFGGFGPDVRIPTGIDGVGKGALRPAQNVKDIQSIDAPVPGSPLNREHRNPMPEGRSLLQRLLSDERMLDRPDHPANGMYLQALDGIGKLNAEHGVAASPRDTRFAGSLTVAATAEGMRGIDHVLMSDDASRAFAVEGNLLSVHGLDRKIAAVDTVRALETPLERSSAAWPEAADQGRQLGEQQQ